MTDIDRLYHKIKDHYNHRRCLMNASAEELTFLVELLDEMERDDFGKDTNVPTKWVSVKDKLPEHGKRYLIYATSGDGKERHITTAAYGGHFALTGRCAYWKVTHWMPMPRDPEEETE